MTPSRIPRLAAFALAAAALPASAQFAGSTASAAPRLLFSNADIPALQSKVQTGIHAQMLSAITGQLQPNLSTNVDTYAYDISYEARNNAFLYILTGNESYAQRSLAMTNLMVNNTTIFNNDGSKGLTRATLGMAAAITYDLCKNAPSWAADKSAISTKIKLNADSLMRNGGTGWAGGSGGNNWWSVRFSAAGLSYLATDDNSNTTLTNGGSVSLSRADVLKSAHNMLVTHFNQNQSSANPALALTGNGWNGESLGYSQYPWQYAGPFALAYRRSNNIDLLTAPAPTLPSLTTGRPGGVGNYLAGGTPITASTQYSLWANYVGAVPIERTNEGHLGKGLHGDFADDNPVWNGQGTANLAFALSPAQYVPGIQHMYDRMSGATATGGDGYFDSDRAGGLYGVLYYPAATSQDPAAIPGWGKTYIDQSMGMVISRNRYQDQNDIVAQIDAKSHRPSNGHSGPDSNAVRLIGLGGFWLTGPGRNGDPRGHTGVYKKDPNTYSLTSDNSGTGGAGPGDVTNNRGFIIASAFDAAGNGYAVSQAVNPYATTPTYLSRTEVFRHKRMLVTDYAGDWTPGVFLIADRSQSDGDADPSNGGIATHWRLNTPEFNNISILNPAAGEFLLTAPNGSRLYGRILHGDPATFRTGTFARGDGTPQDSGFPMGDTVYHNNKWLDFQSPDGQFLVLFALLEPGMPLPSLTTTGTGPDQTITLGNRRLTINGDAATLSTITDGRFVLRDNPAIAPVVSHIPIAGTPGNWTGTLDIRNSDLIVQNAAATADALREQIAFAYNGGLWDRPGITSSLAAPDGLAIGFANNADLALATFANNPVTPNDLLIKYTWFGDANLDGQVDGDDYLLWLAVFGSTGPGINWAQGDFDYDADTDGDDYLLWLQNFGNGIGNPLNVPEPAALTLATLTAGALLARRRTRRVKCMA